MSNYLLPEDDGLAMLPYGKWTKIKLDYLTRYIDIFETSMYSKPWRKRHYIDLFSGPGKCYVPETKTKEIYLGSPLIALTTTHPFTDYYFVDQDSNNIHVLDQRCKASENYKNINLLIGDCNEKVNVIVDRILSVDSERIPERWSSLNLAFLDPQGIDLKWNTVKTLARPSRMDLIIHYSQMGLTRYMPIAYKEDGFTSIDMFFGSLEWRKIYDRFQRREDVFLHRELMDHYKDNLRSLGYKEVLRDDEVNDEPLMRNARSTPLYRLIFASKHPLGIEFWQKITRRDVFGQGRLPI